MPGRQDRKATSVAHCAVPVPPASMPACRCRHAGWSPCLYAWWMPVFRRRSVGVAQCATLIAPFGMASGRACRELFACSSRTSMQLPCQNAAIDARSSQLPCGDLSLGPYAKQSQPFQRYAKNVSFQSELRTGRAEVLAMTGSANACGRRASQDFSPIHASALVILRKTMKDRLA